MKGPEFSLVDFMTIYRNRLILHLKYYYTHSMKGTVEI